MADKITPIVTIESNPYFVQTEPKQVIVKMMDGVSPLDNYKLGFWIDDVTQGITRSQNGVGTWMLDTSTLQPGTHTLRAVCAVTTTTNAVIATQEITVYESTNNVPSEYYDNYDIDVPTTINVKNGLAQSLLVKYLDIGTYSLTGQFSGTTTYAPGQGTGTITIYKMPTTCTFTSSSTEIDFGESVTLTISVRDIDNRPVSSGTVSIQEDSTSIIFNQAVAIDGTCTVSYTPTTSGTHYVTATYAGTSNQYESSTSIAQPITANKIITTTIINDTDTLATDNGLYYNTRWLYQGSGNTAQQVYLQDNYYYSKAVVNNYKVVYFNYPIPKQSDSTIHCKYYTTSRSGSLEMGLIGLVDLTGTRGIGREFMYAHESNPSWEYGEWRQNLYVQGESLRVPRSQWTDIEFHMDYGKISVTYNGNTYGEYTLPVDNNTDLYLCHRNWGAADSRMGDVQITISQ